jgi:hypothetical protein
LPAVEVPTPTSETLLVPPSSVRIVGLPQLTLPSCITAPASNSMRTFDNGRTPHTR